MYLLYYQLIKTSEHSGSSFLATFLPDVSPLEQIRSAYFFMFRIWVVPNLVGGQYDAQQNAQT
jgi:hypothetical protein